MSDLFTAALGGALEGATLTIETSGLPPVTIALDSSSSSSAPSPIMQALRPRVTIRRGSTVLLAAAPHGAPDQGIPWALIAAVVGVACTAFVVSRTLR